MTLDEIKQEMMSYQDFFGGQLLEVQSIKHAKTKEDLKVIIDSHNDHLEMMVTDAQSSLNRFRQRLGLNV